MIKCLQFYLLNGLVEYERVNLNTKMLIESTSEEFVEFMEGIEIGVRYDKKDLYLKFIQDYPEHKNFNQKTLSGWIKTYAKLKGLKFEIKNSGNSKGFILEQIVQMDEENESLGGEGII